MASTILARQTFNDVAGASACLGLPLGQFDMTLRFSFGLADSSNHVLYFKVVPNSQTGTTAWPVTHHFCCARDAPVGDVERQAGNGKGNHGAGEGANDGVEDTVKGEGNANNPGRQSCSSRKCPLNQGKSSNERFYCTKQRCTAAGGV